MQSHRRIQGIPENVVEVEVGEALALGEAVGMHHQERTQCLGLGEERAEARVGKFLAVHVGQDLRTLETERTHDAVEFFGGAAGVLERNGAEAGQPVRLTRDEGGNTIVGQRVCLGGEIRRQGVVALARRRCDNLDIDAHAVHVAQPSVEVRVHDLRPVCILHGVDLTRRRIGEKRQRDLLRIDMRAGEAGCFRHDDVAMNVDCGGAGATHPAGRGMGTGGGQAVTVFRRAHGMVLLVGQIVTMPPNRAERVIASKHFALASISAWVTG
ncbi:MAG: hypothetical protein JWQ55_5558 [Rhodopila sp.]|nr:hypothetical protein [Rhodopila sp.]